MNDPRIPWLSVNGDGRNPETPEDGVVPLQDVPFASDARVDGAPSPVRPPEPPSNGADAEEQDEPETWGSDLPSKATYTVIRRAHHAAPEIDRRFILAVANNGDRHGLDKVRSHHRSLYLAAKAGDLSVLKRVEADLAKNVRGIHRQVAELSRCLDATARYHDVLRKSEPWGAFDAVRAAVCGALMLLCVGAGANTLAQTMVGSGVTGFEDYARDLLFSFLVVAFPMVIECFVQRTFGEGGRRWMRALICLLATASFGAWVWSFAQTFSIAGASAADLAEALAHRSADPGQKINTLTVFQIVSEVLVAAVCALELQHLFESHRLSDRTINPQFAKTQKDLAWWRRLQREEEELLGQARGRLWEIEEGLKVFTESAAELYQLARVAAEQHRTTMALLDP